MELVTKQEGLQGVNADLFSRFITFIDAKPKTIETYSRALKQFIRYLQANGITKPTRADIIAYRDELKRTVKPATVQIYVIAVKQFFKWLHQEGIYSNVAENVKGAKIEKTHKKDALTTRQIKDVLAAIDLDTSTGKRDYAIFSLMVTGGLRTIEVSRANIEDIRTVGDSTVLFIQGKGKDEKADYVKLPAPVEKAIRNYLNSRGKVAPDEPLFSSTSNNNQGDRMTTRAISAIIKGRLLTAGYNSDRLTAHSLRHTAGTLNLLNGGTLDETQQLLRHTNINTTMIYLHHIDRAKNQSEQRIAAAIF
jgi:integrase/recombinase XerD